MGEEEPRKIVIEQGSPRGFSGTLSIGSKEDAEEIREILSAVSDFLKELKDPIEKLINTLLSLLEGEKVGRDVAAFYQKLKEAGVPEDLATDMTRRYFEERVSTLNIIKKLGELAASSKSGHFTWRERKEE